ncbi:hypothetical protein LOTGIDRAFT_165046 [Lottia gigantea]|uniref:Ig-like domain-containing protein n=1 Tax=Lottia gigantea TaxID=225164 RepID=V4A3E6_LOTGI|nr:hypothetical protein LOTGIDRAFT_165046 [Lottia gigantea]ESO89450.1 hypothetical protein LOTGIDRAFT_165046 [Lottia gigantea]
MYLRSYISLICMLALLVLTRKITGEFIFKNQILKKICLQSDVIVQYCSYSVCRGTDQLVRKSDTSVEVNSTHWWASLQIATTGSLNCFNRYPGNYQSPTSTIYVSVYELNNTAVTPSNDPIEISEGGTLRVNCSVESVPNVTLTWVTPREDITTQDTLEDELVVDNTMFNDTGVYQCSVWNDILRLRSTKYFNVSILCAPRPHDPRIYPDKISFVPGQTIHLKAAFIANPPPVFSWKKKTDGSSHTIENDKRVTTRQTESLADLTITDTVLDDRGLYRVVAENGIGEGADLFFTVGVQETIESSSPDEDADANTEDEMKSVYIGVGVGIGVFVLLIVAVAVVICHRRRQRPVEKPSATEIEPKNKKPKSLKDLAKRKPHPPSREDRPEVPRYSTQLKMGRRGKANGRAREENYEQPVQGGGALYQQELYEDLQHTEYYNH